MFYELEIPLAQGETIVSRPNFQSEIQTSYLSKLILWTLLAWKNRVNL